MSELTSYGFTNSSFFEDLPRTIFLKPSAVNSPQAYQKLEVGYRVPILWFTGLIGRAYVVKPHIGGKQQMSNTGC
jgi:hypothetical protein